MLYEVHGSQNFLLAGVGRDSGELDAFEVIFAEVNEAITPVSFSGRILIHTMEVLMDEVFPKSAYNMHTQRFVSKKNVTTFPGTAPSDRAKAPSDIAKNMGFGPLCHREQANVLKLGSKFVGKQHIEAMTRVLSTSDIPFIVNQIAELTEQLIEDVQEYV